MNSHLRDFAILSALFLAMLNLFGIALLLDYVLELRKALSRLRIKQTGFVVYQLQGAFIMPITGIVAGSTGVFKETPLPVGAIIPAGTVPKWSTSDTTNTSITPSADGTQCAVAIAAGATITTFNLSVSNQDGSFLTTVAVPVTQPAPPPPPPQTGFQIDQIS